MIKFDDTSVFNLLTATFFWCVILQRTWNLNKSSLKPKKVLSSLSTFTHWNRSLRIWSVCWDMHSMRCMQRCMHYNVSLLKKTQDTSLDIFINLWNGEMILALTGTTIIIVSYGVLKYSGNYIFLIIVPNLLCTSVTLPL